MFRNVYIVFLVTIAISVLVESRTVFRDDTLGIIGGKEATPHESPSTVRLFTFTENSSGQKIFHYRCGANLISEKYLLTAKHCTVRQDGTLAFLGDHDSETLDAGDEVQTIYKQNFIQHPSADLALIELNTSVTFSNAIKSISLPLKKDVNETYVGQTGTAFGWGLISDNRTAAQNLIKVDVNVIPNTQCRTKLLNVNIFGPRSYELCTSGNSANTPLGTCAGDSGGPFFINNILVGITDYGPPRCNSGGPSVYISTGKFLDWIEKETGIQLQ